MVAVQPRVSQISLAFMFRDTAGNVVTPASAECELVYPGRDWFDRETLTLTQNATEPTLWEASWNSSRAAEGWVRFHAHGVSSDDPPVNYIEDGRFKLSANLASYSHDRLPSIVFWNCDYPWR